MSKAWSLRQNAFGYYEIVPKPSEDELRAYYAEKYYQEGHGSYEVTYTDEEVDYFRLKASLVHREVRRRRPDRRSGTFLDVGCGEGWMLDRFSESGYDVTGVDYSDVGLVRWNPHLRDRLLVGDYARLLTNGALSDTRYDVIALANVIEHVPDPRELLGLLGASLAPGGLLVVVAPNDFSELHHHLLERGAIDEPFWLVYPDHLSYFDRDSMTRLLQACGFGVESVVADNPIDLNLLNDNSNYVRDRSKGRNTHLHRVRTDLFLAGVSEEHLLDLYTVLGRMGVGRDLTFYCSVRPEGAAHE